MGGKVLFKVRVTKSRQPERFQTPVESTKENTFPREIIPNTFSPAAGRFPCPWITTTRRSSLSLRRRQMTGEVGSYRYMAPGVC